MNQYIDGVPHLVEAVELSSTGVLVRRILGPETSRASYAIELAAEGKRSAVFLCARPIWQDGDLEALGFVAPSPLDKSRLADLLASAAA
jgi:hypothetical protein